jgi:NDP-sugar pyrophosphorylase family protein/aminoglycoside/choline kinase family phosphotransferase
MNLSVFILAAGLGERLRPITNHIPKPLMPILGKPLLQSVLEKASALRPRQIGINLHHKKELIQDWVYQSAFSNEISLFPEDPILGTGGALKHAGEFLKNSQFLVHNADILSDLDLEKLVAFHRESGNLATLAVHAYPEFNNLVVDANGYLIEIGAFCSLCRAPGSRLLAFTGIAVYQPQFLQFLPEGSSSILHSWTQAISAGYKIGTYDVTGCYWTDIGTPASYAKAVVDELRKIGETVYLHPSAQWCKDIEFDGYIVIEKQSNPPSPPFSRGGMEGFSKEIILNKNIVLRNCILLPGSEIEAKEQDDSAPECLLALFWGKGPDTAKLTFENCILGPEFQIDFSESDLFESDDENTFHIGTGGSDRKYYRVKRNKHPVILMQCPDDDPDFQRHIEYTQFFHKYAIPVPELIDTDNNKKTAVFEDLGDLSLYSWLKCPRNQEEIEGIYRKILDIVVLLHTTVTDHVSECTLLEQRVFDYDHLRWETRYFLERFIFGVRNMRDLNHSSLEEEVHRLALQVDSFPKTIVHRDFQSQNIMIIKGNIPRIIDYQGARIGPPAYDVVSLLWDPYYRLDDDLRESILNYYIHKVIPPPPPLENGGEIRLNAEGNAASRNSLEYPFTQGGSRGITEKEFRQSLLPCRLQRHMQALGAYGFLSAVKGKGYFLKYIPEGLRLLNEDIRLAQDEYPALFTLVGSIV